MKAQYEYLKKLEHILFQGFQVTKNVLKNDKYEPTYRGALINDNQVVDHRTIASNEIVIDLDFRSYTLTYKHVNMLRSVLEDRQIPYYIFSTGGKGVHIHLFFDKIDLNGNTEIKELFNDALSMGFTWKHIRMFLFEMICEEAGINKAYIGKYLDTQKINFNDLDNNTVLIRACGGRNQKYDAVTGTTEITYKSLIPNDDFVNKRINVTNISNVKYPFQLDTFSIDIHELGKCLKDFINTQTKNNIEPIKQIKLSNGYTGLASIQRIIEGLEEGLRSEGARVLSLALILDNFGDNRAKQVLEQYVNNCSQIGHQFTLGEALNWYKWLKHQPSHYWNNECVKKLGVWDKDTDEYHKLMKKDSNKLLSNKGLLKRIDDYLKTVIVGEKKIRLLIFLLLLSSKFRVDKDWNIPGDPKPQSIILSSMSASGKSYITKEILKLFGEKDQDFYTFSRMTSSTLNYFTDVDMNGKILFVEELQGMDKESNQLRLWISEGELKLATVEKVESEGETRNKLVFKENIGQPVFITGTAEDAVDEQMNNRSWLISLDISEEQNKAILEYESRIYSKKRDINNDELRILKDSIKELDSYHFIIPYFNYEWLNIPTEDVRIRRDFKKFGVLIACVTLLHQKQRVMVTDEHGREYLVSNLDDYEIAKKYSEDVLENTFSGLTAQQISVLDMIKAQGWHDEFESSDVQRNTGWSQSKTWMTLSQLDEIGVITSSGKGQGSTMKYALNPNKKLSNLKLPSSEELLEIVKVNNTTYYDILKNYTFHYQEGVKIGVFTENVISVVNNDLLQKSSHPPCFQTLINESENSSIENSTKNVAQQEGSGQIITFRNNFEKTENKQEMIKKYFDESKKHKIHVNELVNEFGNTIIEQLQQLKNKGDVFVDKHNNYMLL